VEEKMEDLRKVKDSETAAEIKSKTEALSQALQKIGADLYKQADQSGESEKKSDDEGKAEEGEYKDKN
jgi:molecular chaperone DnaK